MFVCLCERERDISLQRLRELDPEYADSLERNDWYRLKRALDVCTQSGRYTYNTYSHSLWCGNTLALLFFLIGR